MESTTSTPRFPSFKTTLAKLGTKAGNITDGQLRWLVFIFSALLVGTGLYVSQTFAWLPLLMVLNLTAGAPRMKATYTKTNKWLALYSIVALMAGLLIFTWVSQTLAMLTIGLGLFPQILEMQSQALKKAVFQPAKVTKMAKVAKVIVKKDPAERSNIQRRRDAFLARHGRKGKSK